MKHGHLLAALGVLVTLFASCRVGFSGLETWHNCTTNACKSYFTSRICANTTSTCQCGVTINQSTCSIDPAIIANQTGTSGLNANQGQLSCCMCESNDTFCCSACPVNTTSVPSTTATTTTTTAASISTTIAPTTSFPSVEQAILVAIFILKHDISTYSSRTTELSQSYQYAVGNLTKTADSLTDIAPTFLTGVLPYCGFQVDSYVNKPIINSNPEQCNSLVINATIKKDVSSSTSLPSTIKLITDSVKDGNFQLTLLDGSQIKAAFMLYKLSNSSYDFHRGPYEASTDSPTKAVPPIHTNLWPLIYSGIGVFSLIALCIAWQCCKQSYLLRKKKFTDINSNRVNTRKKKIQEAMSNQESIKGPQRERGMFDMTHNKMQQVDNEALTRRYDWTTPSYLPNMLAPAYAPTELHGQHSPPRLMLDDDDDSDSDKKSLGKASVINVDEETDEDLKDILESDDDDELVFKERINTRQSSTSRKKSVSISNKRKPSTTSKASKTSRSTRNTSAKSTAKITNPALGQVRKCSYSGPEGQERTPSLGFGNLKSNRVTPVSDERKSSVSSGKRQKKESSNC